MNNENSNLENVVCVEIPTNTKKTYDQKAYNKKYYAEHKEATLKRLMAVVICDKCGSTATYQHLGRHQKGKLCQKRALQKVFGI